MKTTSGSPASWAAKRKAYRAQSGPVSNPGQPSPTNRKMRRFLAWAKKQPDFGVNPTLDPRD